MPSPPSPTEVKKQLRENGEEYHYRNEVCDIDGTRAGESRLHVGHFVVAKDARGNGIATTLLDALLDVMREEDLRYLTIKMGATECRSRDDLIAQREEHGNSWQDPTHQFLEANGFRRLEYVEDRKWGLCVRGDRHI